MISNNIFNELNKRLGEPRRFIQVLSGPRQVGKTTLIQKVLKQTSFPCHYASADEPTVRDRVWLEQQWETGRLLLKDKSVDRALLVLDEIQKISGWSETVKRLWDEDTKNGLPFFVVCLGSAPLLIHSGLTESLAGRFEVLRMTHWSFSDMREAFGWPLDRYVYFGGYPGAAALADDETRWTHYILDSIIEATVSRDILLLNRVDKPALLRRLFHLGCEYSSQILSYQKMTGQLQDAGNTTTLAHYLDLLQSSGLLCGLDKFYRGKVRQRASSPKLQVLNAALLSAQSVYSFAEARRNPDFWGRLVESAVGAHLMNTAWGTKTKISYWREGHAEVDFVLSRGKKTVAIEVKSGRRRDQLPGMSLFDERFYPTRKLLVGGDGISVEEFLLHPAEHWF